MRLFISMVVPGMPFNGDSLTKDSIGGSETAGLSLATELAKLGHRIHLFCNTDKPSISYGIDFYPLDSFRRFASQVPHDVTIVQRMPEAFSIPINSKLHILWLHDLALKRDEKLIKSVLWNVDAIAVVSDFMKKQYAETLGFEAIDKLEDRPKNSISAVTKVFRNGIDLGMFPKGLPREPAKLMFCARPERGLDVLLKTVFPKVLEKVPKAQLYLATYDNPVNQLAPFYAQCQSIAERFGNRVVQLGSLPKPDLYLHYVTTRVYVYPTPSPIMPDFKEVSCISAMEAIAAGTPIVTTKNGALPETIGDKCGALIELGEGYVDTFVEHVVRLITNEQVWKHRHNACLPRAEELTWSKRAQEWSEYLVSECSRGMENIERLTRHFYKHSDIIAGWGLGKGHELSTHIEREWGFIESEEAFREHYRKISESHDTTVESFENVGGGARLQVLKNWLSQRPKIKRVLDWGCDRGEYCIHLSNDLPDVEFFGVDVAINSIGWCERQKQKHAKHKENLAFFLDSAFPESDSGLMDLAVMQEVLEHVAKPWDLADRVEHYVKPGGKVYITVPYGPWEYMTYRTYPYRCHLWEFDAHDLEEMFGKKPDCKISALPSGTDELLGRPIGWHVVEYTADHAPVGKVDLDRKRALQRPPETLSALLIGGPKCELTLEWCLDSIKDIADEILIGDCGLSPVAQDIANRYGAHIVTAAMPLKKGFDMARNSVLEQCSMDWVLWIDTDERLTDPQRLVKYLRPGTWNGFGIRQFHHTVDTAFTPDMPVRLIRRDRGLKFYGCLTPDTLIATNPGLISITDVKVGNFVRTHDGSYRPVTKLWEYETEDDLIEINAVGLPKPIKLTKNHELYAIRSEKCYYDKEYNVRCKPICNKQNQGCPHKFYEHYAPEFIRADNLNEGDFLLYPIDDATQDKESVKLSYHAKEGRLSGSGSSLSWKLESDRWVRDKAGQRATLADNQSVSASLLRLAGYYVSDGCIKEGKLHLFFGAHEVEYVEDIKEIAKEFGIEAIVKHSKNAEMWDAKVSSRPLCEWIVGEFGSGSHKKKAPLWVMRLPVSKQEHFLTGLWRGDGNVSGSLVRYCTVSQDLAQQVQDLLLRMGICANFRFGKASKAYEVFARVKRRKFLDWDMPSDGYDVPQQSWTDGKYVYLRVKSIKEFQYKGKVYDLSVDGNHSYVANRVAVHNCIHEHPELEMNLGPGPVIVLSDTCISHVGYLCETVRQRRFFRNLPMMQMDVKENPERLLQKFFLLRDQQIMAKYLLEQNGMVLTEDIAKLCEDTVSLYKKYFLGKAPYMSIGESAVTYYSDALRILGRGIDVEFSVKANGAVGPNSLRFESTEDAVIEIERVTRQSLSQDQWPGK